MEVVELFFWKLVGSAEVAGGGGEARGGIEARDGIGARDARDAEGGRDARGAEMAGEVGVATEGAVSEVESNRETGVEISEDWKLMQLFAQSINGLCWCNQHNPITAEILESRGVTRKLTGSTLSGANETGTVTS